MDSCVDIFNDMLVGHAWVTPNDMNKEESGVLCSNKSTLFPLRTLIVSAVTHVPPPSPMRFWEQNV
jgi:hypothetical protein